MLGSLWSEVGRLVVGRLHRNIEMNQDFPSPRLLNLQLWARQNENKEPRTLSVSIY
jgi:hypothetical protein